VELGLQTGPDRVRKTVPGKWTSNGKSPEAAVRVESVTWYVQQISLGGTEMWLDSGTQ